MLSLKWSKKQFVQRLSVVHKHGTSNSVPNTLRSGSLFRSVNLWIMRPTRYTTAPIGCMSTYIGKHGCMHRQNNIGHAKCISSNAYLSEGGVASTCGLVAMTAASFAAGLHGCTCYVILNVPLNARIEHCESSTHVLEKPGGLACVGVNPKSRAQAPRKPGNPAKFVRMVIEFKM